MYLYGLLLYELRSNDTEISEWGSSVLYLHYKDENNFWEYL